MNIWHLLMQTLIILSALNNQVNSYDFELNEIPIGGENQLQTDLKLKINNK